MHPMAIIGIAVGVGLVVYAVSLWSGVDEVLSLGHPQEAAAEPAERGRRRRKRRTDAGPGPEPPARDPTPPEAVGRAPGDSFAYVRVEPAERTPSTTRVAGFLGLLVIIAASAATLAAAIYEVGHLINQTIARYLGK
jgi:hypothetical protein